MPRCPGRVEPERATGKVSEYVGGVQIRRGGTLPKAQNVSESARNAHLLYNASECCAFQSSNGRQLGFGRA